MDASGTETTANVELPRGVIFWKAQGLSRGVLIDAPSATWEFFVGAASAPVNTAWGSVLDVNGDGFADIVVGVPQNAGGAVYVYLGGPAGVARVAESIVTMSREGTWFGYVGNAGDTNGDGFADLVVVSTNYVDGENRAFVYLGGPTGIATDPTTSIDGPMGWNARAGSAGDVNGDGYSDVFFAFDGRRDGLVVPAAIHVHLGGPDGVTAAVSAMASMPAQPLNLQPPAGAIDVNGDGYSDLMFHGGIYLGSAAGITPIPSRTLSTDEAGSVGDMNGDGYCDVAAAVRVVSPLSEYWYTLEVFAGGPAGVVSAPISTSSIVRFSGSSFQFRRLIQSAGDINADGFGDVVFGTLGAVYLLTGTAGGVSAVPSVRLTAGLDPGLFGVSLVGGEDMNGDTIPDLVIGAGREVLIYHGTGSGFSETPTTVLMDPEPGDGTFGALIAMGRRGARMWDSHLAPRPSGPLRVRFSLRGLYDG